MTDFSVAPAWRRPDDPVFSDRPDRITGHGTTEEMVNAWSEGDERFAADPPNATLSILGGDEIQDAVVVISDPCCQTANSPTQCVYWTANYLPMAVHLPCLSMSSAGR